MPVSCLSYRFLRKAILLFFPFCGGGGEKYVWASGCDIGFVGEGGKGWGKGWDVFWESIEIPFFSTVMSVQGGVECTPAFARKFLGVGDEKCVTN